MPDFTKSAMLLRIVVELVLVVERFRRGGFRVQETARRVPAPPFSYVVLPRRAWETPRKIVGELTWSAPATTALWLKSRPECWNWFLGLPRGRQAKAASRPPHSTQAFSSVVLR